MRCPTTSSRKDRPLVGLLASLFAALAFLPADSVAQGRPEAAPRPSSEAAPVVRFDPAGITLEEAVRLTLQYDPAIKRQEAAVRSQEGVLQESGGPFDAVFSGSASYSYASEQLTQSQKLLTGATDVASHAGTFALQLARAFRSGPSLSPFVDLAYEGTRYTGLTTTTFGVSPSNLYTSRAGVGFALPLARGLGTSSVRAVETAARHGRDAERLALDHQVAASALATIQAYWDVRAAQETAAITARWVDSQVKLTELTRGLIQADELPRAEISRAQAAEARARAELGEAKRTLHGARVALALAAGVAATGDDATLPGARDDFPAPPDVSMLTDPVVAQLGDRAVAERADVAAAVLRERAGAAAEEGARADVRPRVDVVARAYVTARDDGRPFSAWNGPGAEVSLEAERPIGNNALLGQWLARQAESSQARIAAADLRRQVVLGVVESAGALKEIAERVRQAEAAVGFARATVEAELERFRTGESTLIDTVLTEQQQTESELVLVAARRDLFQEIARLRFQAGQLAPGGKPGAGGLTSLPSPGGREQ
jgi:outer membrane protein